MPTGQVSAYSIHSGLTEGCHEKMTQTAFLSVLPNLNPDASLALPKTEVWRKFAQGMIRVGRLKERFPQMENESFQLMLISVIIGVRSPDTEGHATSNISDSDKFRRPQSGRAICPCVTWRQR